MARIKIAYINGGSSRDPGTMSYFVAQGENFDGSEIACSERADDHNKTIRGGSYQNRAAVTPRFGPQDQELQPLRCAVRDYFHPDDRNDITGFRVVREVQ